jgi:hypothetical protein
MNAEIEIPSSQTDFVRAEARGDRSGGSRLPGLHPCRREGGALSPSTEKGRPCRSEAEGSRQSRDR